MTIKQVKKVIKDIPLGSTIQLIKKNGDIIEVRLASHEVSGTKLKDYGDLIVPALPPAIIVNGHTRFGNYRIDIQEILKIAWIG